MQSTVTARHKQYPGFKRTVQEKGNYEACSGFWKWLKKRCGVGTRVLVSRAMRGIRFHSLAHTLAWDVSLKPTSSWHTKQTLRRNFTFSLAFNSLLLSKQEWVCCFQRAPSQMMVFLCGSLREGARGRSISKCYICMV